MSFTFSISIESGLKFDAWEIVIEIELIIHYLAFEFYNLIINDNIMVINVILAFFIIIFFDLIEPIFIKLIYEI